MRARDRYNNSHTINAKGNNNILTTNYKIIRPMLVKNVELNQYRNSDKNEKETPRNPRQNPAQGRKSCKN